MFSRCLVPTAEKTALSYKNHRALRDRISRISKNNELPKVKVPSQKHREPLSYEQRISEFL